MEKEPINTRFLEVVAYLLDNGSVKNKSDMADLLGIKPSKFSEILNQRMNVGTDLIGTICSKFSTISSEWLLTGKGDMIKPNVQHNTHTPMLSKLSDSKDTKTIDTFQINQKKNTNAIPLVAQTAIAGFGSNNFSINEQDIKELYNVPKFRHHHVDFMIEIAGSSMYPKYNSGDVVACTILHDNSFIQWNKTHIIATREQGILCKRIMPGNTSDTLLMVSDNDKYPPFEVPKNDITGIALVVGVIRLE